jgi:3',5'-cyclic-AMP phosphodiesterase
MDVTRVELPHRGSRVRVAQLTDTHLEERPGGTLLGMDTDASLGHVLELLRGAPADLLLATGDLASHGAESAYLRLRERFDALGLPWFWLPGNHDAREPIERVFGRGRPMVRSICVGAWQIVMLDSTVDGEVGGTLGADELALLDELLAAEPRRHALVCLHHQPVAIGCAWLDEQMVTDSSELFAVLERHAQARALLWGHVHQDFSQRRGGLQLLATPSTCIQFAPASESFRLDGQPPGMRWLELHADGRLETRVARVSGVEFSYDRDSAGYL